MASVKLLRILSKVKRCLDAAGVGKARPVDQVVGFVKRRCFSDIYGDSVVRVRINGMIMTFPRRFATHFVFSEYEPLTRQTMAASIRSGMCVIDVGAHVGYFTLLASRLVGPAGAVHSIEPSPGNINFLRANVNANHLQNVRIYPVAAGRIQQQRVFCLTESSDSDGFFPHPNAPTVRRIEVAEVAIDDLIVGPVDALKLDVEGVEIEVLEGMTKLLARSPSLVVWAEWFPAGMHVSGHDPIELPECLRRAGFCNILVLDETSKKIRTVSEVGSLLKRGELPKHWYGNLYAKRK